MTLTFKNNGVNELVSI